MELCNISIKINTVNSVYNELVYNKLSVLANFYPTIDLHHSTLYTYYELWLY